MIPFLSSLLPTVNNVIDRLVPDKNAQAKMKLDLATMAAKGELDQMAGQLQINAKEAESPHLFVAGWRPFVGWVCGAGLALMLFLKAIVPLIAMFMELDAAQIEASTEGLNWAMGTLSPILMVMLGARTVEKVKGVQRENLS